MRKNETHLTKRGINMKMNGHVGRGRPKVWTNCMKEVINKMGVDCGLNYDG